MKAAGFAAATGLLMSSCVGIHGPKGNDTGGIIPWSPASGQMAFEIAQENCGRYKKYAVFRSVRPTYGDYVSYECRFDPPRRGQRTARGM